MHEHTHHHDAAHEAGVSPHDAFVEAVSGEVPHALPAVDVRVVAPVPTEDRGARTIVSDQVPVDSTGARVAGHLRTRARLVLKGQTNPVWLGARGVTPGTGYLLGVGETLTIFSTSAVYAVAASGAAGVVHVLAEVREG